MNTHFSSIAKLPDVYLLGKLVSTNESLRPDHGPLQLLFKPLVKDSPTDEICTILKEFMWRSLNEGLRRNYFLSMAGSVRHCLCPSFAALEQERSGVLFLVAQSRPIAGNELFRDTLKPTLVDPHKSVWEATRYNTVTVIFSHNSPLRYGETQQVRQVGMNALKSALALVDVEVLDHFSVASSKAICFSDQGLL